MNGLPFSEIRNLHFSSLSLVIRAVCWIVVKFSKLMALSDSKMLIDAPHQTAIRKGRTVCSLSVNELAWFANATPQSVVRVLARLRKEGLVKAAPHPEDGPITLCTLTLLLYALRAPGLQCGAGLS